MREDGEVNRKSLWRERVFVKGFLTAVFIALTHFVHTDYYMGGSSLPPPAVAGNTPVYYLFRPVPPPIHAPEAYRVAIPAIGSFLVRVLYSHDPGWIAAALDFVFGSIACYQFYRVAVAGFSATSGRLKERLLVVGFFLAFLQFAIPWVVYRQRPETMPTALFLAIALYALTRSNEGAIWSLILLVAAAFQAFVRADVPFAFGIGLALASLMGGTLSEFGSRSSTLLKGMGIALVSGGAQAYLQLVRFPHLTYWPGTNVVQWRNNLGFHYAANCFVALLPYLVVGFLLMIKRVRLDAVDTVIVVVSAIYLAMWFSVGLLDEVRIYVPFMMALSVVAAKFSASCILGSDSSLPDEQRRSAL